MTIYLPPVPAWMLIGAVLFLVAWLGRAAWEGYTVTRRRLLVRRLEKLYALPSRAPNRKEPR